MGAHQLFQASVFQPWSLTRSPTTHTLQLLSDLLQVFMSLNEVLNYPRARIWTHCLPTHRKMYLCQYINYPVWPLVHLFCSNPVKMIIVLEYGLRWTGFWIGITGLLLFRRDTVIDTGLNCLRLRSAFHEWIINQCKLISVQICN